MYEKCIPVIPEMVLFELSANTPCIGGIIEPPKIIIINKDEPWPVYFPKPAMAKEKIEGHMIEQHKPPLTIANKPKVPVVHKPNIMVPTPNKPNIVSVRTGL